MAGSRPPGSHRMPEDSSFYDKVVPPLLLALGVLTLVLLLQAAVPADAKQRYAVYTDTTFRFSFHYPATWTRHHPPPT